jgi:hypothetical protein
MRVKIFLKMNKNSISNPIHHQHFVLPSCNMNPVLLPSAYLSQCFSTAYVQAARKFEKLVNSKPNITQYLEFVYSDFGPQQEKLVTAVFWQGEPDAQRVLVIQSATHGVEGFSGSAIQIDTLNQLPAEKLDRDLAIVYIHAINPYGFAWLRRVNEQGVDLNRNFIDFSQALPVNAEYLKLADSLLPVFETDWDKASCTLQAYAKDLGQQALELAITAGQYQCADGLFYGGRAPSQSRLNLEKIIDDFKLAEREQVAVIDVHTGLGPFGYGELICDHPPASQGVAWARQWYGDSVTEPALGTSSSVSKLGLIDYLWQQRLAERVCFVTLEFGTYNMAKMLDVLRRDHMLHRSAVDWSQATTQQIKQAMRQFFYPDTADWQEMVLLRGRQVVNQALRGLRPPV